jgi:hypothetical protein
MAFWVNFDSSSLLITTQVDEYADYRRFFSAYSATSALKRDFDYGKV